MSEVLLLKGNNLIFKIRGGITMNINNLIVKNMDNPMSWRRCIEKIRKLLKSILTSMGSKPDSQVLGAWYERLHFKETANAEKSRCFKRFLIYGHVSYSGRDKHQNHFLLCRTRSNCSN